MRSSQGAFQRKDHRTMEGRKGSLRRMPSLSGVSSGVNHKAVHWVRPDGISFGQRTGFQSPGTDFSMKYKTERLSREI